MKVIALGEVYSKYIMDGLPEQGVVIGATKEELRTLPPTILNCEVEVIEKNSPRNNKAMREALMKASMFLHIHNMGAVGMPDGSVLACWELAKIVDAALAAPPRNCDRYSHDEALEIWAAEKENGKNGCFDEWLYAPATEQKGDNNGSK